MNRRLALVVGIGAVCVLAACSSDSMKNSPQWINADGTGHAACHDHVWISNEGGSFLCGGETTFRVKYTDAEGLSHVMKGIHKLDVSELSPSMAAMMCKP